MVIDIKCKPKDTLNLGFLKNITNIYALSSKHSITIFLEFLTGAKPANTICLLTSVYISFKHQKPLKLLRSSKYLFKPTII